MRNKIRIVLAAWLVAALGCQAADTAEGLLVEAQQAERSGGMQKAAKLYEEFLQKNPAHSQVTYAHYGLAKCYDALGLVDESNAEFKKVLEGSPQFANRRDALYALGKSYGSGKKYDEAIEVFKKMLAEGAGLYEDEVLSLCGGYYATRGKYDDAAAMLNRLKRRPGSPQAEQAAQRQVALFINARNPALALNSLEDLIKLFPKSKEIPNLMGRVADLYLAQKQLAQAVQLCNRLVESYPKDQAAPQLMLRIGDLYRSEKQYDKAVAICEQVKNAYPKTIEALTSGFLLGLCHRDRKDFAKATEALDQVGKTKEYRADPRMKGLAAEALLQSAEIYFNELGDVPKAMERYSEASVLAREAESDRKKEILERCFFRLADDAYQKKQWGAAFDYYSMLKGVGSELDVMGRMLECGNQLNKLDTDFLDRGFSPGDISNLEARVAANAGTEAGLDLELYLLDRRYKNPKLRLKAEDAGKAAGQYEGLLKKYPPAVLAKQDNHAYIYYQIGFFYALPTNVAEFNRKALEAFDQAVQANPGESNPWRVPALECKVRIADRLGDTNLAVQVSQQLFGIAVEQLGTNSSDPARQQQAIGYLKTLATRSDGSLIDESIKVCQNIIAKHGMFSDLARSARFNLAQLYYQKKDYSAAAAAFKELIALYGPKQDANGDFLEPWKPEPVDEKAEQIYAAALGSAHCWYRQGHQANLIQAYQWMVRNVPYKNNSLAEAQYWLALESVKGQDRETEAGKIKLADTLWSKVVNSNLDLGDPKLKASFYPWVKASEYVKPAILKTARFYHAAGKHDRAAQVLEQYLELFGKTVKNKTAPGYNADDETAVYALGREYIETRDIGKMIQLYQVYLNDLRDSRLRVSALSLMAYHAVQQGVYPAAIEGYATLLDEYGTNAVDKQGAVVRVPAAERVRPGGGWDGIRLPAPKELDQGETRFALGFLYWKQNAWPACIQVLRPFDDDSLLRGNKSRAKALSMLGQSYYQLSNYTNCAKVLTTLIETDPKFEGLEDAYYYAARSYAELGAWPGLERLYKRFVAEWGNSSKRPRMDLLGARLAIGRGQLDKGRANLKSLATGDTTEEVRSDAYFYLGQECLARKPPQWQEAAEMFAKSFEIFPRENVCLAAAKVNLELKNWPKALDLLERAARDFPGGNQQVVAEARSLIPQVLKEAAKVSSKK